MVTEWVQEGVARARKLDDCNTFDANEALLLRQVADGATAPTAGRTPSRSLALASRVCVRCSRRRRQRRSAHADGLLKQLPLLG